MNLTPRGAFVVIVLAILIVWAVSAVATAWTGVPG